MQNEFVSVSSETYSMLKSRIMNMQYRPGEVLLIQQLVKDLNVSRTPIKEALIRLSSDGFLEPYSGNKFRVKEVSVTTVLEVFEIRQALECVVVEALAPVITNEQLAEIAKILARTQEALEAYDTLLVLECDEDFHNYLVQIHGNKTLAEALKQFNERIQQIRFMTQTGRHIGVINEEHKLICSALEAHDGVRARKMMDEHLEKVKSDMKLLLEQQSGALFASAVLRSNLGG